MDTHRTSLPVLCAALLLLGILLLPALPAEAARVGAVEVHVTSEGVPALVRSRMEESVRVIGEQLLLGKRTETVDASQTAGIIRTVFDKVLVGYTVSDVDVKPGETAVIDVGLLPWADTVHTVDVELSVEGMPPEVESLVRQDAAGLGKVFEDGLLGLPVAATDWTNGALKHAVNAYLEENLPEFRADFDIDTAEAAKVHVVLYPRLPVVRTTDLSMCSDTMPNLSLVSHRGLLQREVDKLVGVPVAFIARHKAVFEQQLAETLDREKDYRVFDMHTVVTLTPAEQMPVMVRSDSARYRVRLTGWLDIGRKEYDHHTHDEDLLFRLHLGWMASPHDELFFRTYVYPQEVDSWTELGYARHLGKRAHAEVRYDFDDQRFIFGADYLVAPKWTLRYEYRTKDATGEAALRYDVHDFLALEYAVDKDTGWLRLLGNF